MTLDHRQRQPESESGQAAVLVAFLLFMVFLVFAALAIDGAMTYAVRRDLQNVADAATLAACRVLADNDTTLNSDITTAAYMAAENTVAAHLGSWPDHVGTNPGNPPPTGGTTTNQGVDTNLVKGIEVSPSGVRVAVQSQVPTVLTQFFGRGNPYMLAQARCSSTAGGGLMPIAVRRYDGNPSTNTLVDYVARIGAPQYPTDTVSTAWSPARYSTNVGCTPTTSFCVPLPCGNPGAAGTGNCAGNKNWVASDTNPGPEVVILGSGATPNTGQNSYDNYADLDVRNISAGSPYIEYYHGTDGSLNTDKAIERQWYYTGYPGPYFLPGEELGVLSGAGAAFEAGAMANYHYKVGDAVSVIVYDGNVWDTPDFNITLSPNCNNNCNNGTGVASTFYPTSTTTAISYTVSIAKNGSTNWSTSLSFDLYAKLNETSGAPNIQMRMVDSSGTYDLTWDTSPLASYTSVHGFHYATPAVNQTSGWSGTLYVWTTTPITTTPSYLSGLNLVAISSQGRNKGVSSQFGYGTTSGFTVRAGSSPASTAGGALAITQGGTTKAIELLTTYGWGSTCNNNATVTPDVYSADGSTLQTWTSFFAASDRTGVTIDVKSSGGPNQRNNTLPSSYVLHATASAPTGPYIMRFVVNCLGVTHQEDVPLVVAASSSGSTPTRFVVFHGYSVFRITYMDANTVKGQAISPLYRSLSEVTFGLQPRLVPWQ